MFRYIIFIFLFAIIIYYIGSLLSKWLSSTKKAVERKEYEAWEKYDKRINNTTKKKNAKSK